MNTTVFFVSYGCFIDSCNPSEMLIPHKFLSRVERLSAASRILHARQEWVNSGLTWKTNARFNHSPHKTGLSAIVCVFNNKLKSKSVECFQTDFHEVRGRFAGKNTFCR